MTPRELRSHRQLPGGRADRRAGAHGVGLPAAPRWRSGVLGAAAEGGRRFGAGRVRDRHDRPHALRADLPAQLRHHRDAPVRRARRRAAHPRFRSAVSQPRPRVQADDVRAQRGAARRAADTAPAAASHRRLRRALRRRHHRQPSHPLRGRRAALSRDHRRVARRRCSRTAPWCSSSRCISSSGPDETLQESPAALAREFLGATLELLAGMGAHARGARGLAGRGDPRGHHAQAVHLRGHRRRARRADHLDPGGRRTARATGITVTAGCATATSWCRRSTASARRAPWRPICTTSITSSPRRPPISCSRCTASPAIRAPRRRSPPRCRAIAAWARCASAISPPNRSSTTSTAR